MARKRASAPRQPGHDWYLRQWMETQQINQTQLREKTGWGKGTASEICNGITNYYREIVNEAATALNIQPYELLMHPDEAMALRQFRAQALRVVETTPPFPPGDNEQERTAESASQKWFGSPEQRA